MPDARMGDPSYRAYLIRMMADSHSRAPITQTGSDCPVPDYEELLRRVSAADDLACDGWSDGGCRHCEAVVKALRGGEVMCPECGHINAIGHSCGDWREYDAGRLTLAEVGHRSHAREAGCRAVQKHGDVLRPGSAGPAQPTPSEGDLMSDELLRPTRSLDLTRNEATILYEEIRDECDRCSDGGSIPPQHWRTAANKLQRFLRAWDLVT
jgi:hypothetical protein